MKKLSIIVVKYSKEYDLGKLKQKILQRAQTNWILMLDEDEVADKKLRDEIEKVIQHKSYDAYYIPFQNHFLGKRIKYGGENYRQLRLFKKEAVVIKPALIHEKFILRTGKKAGVLKNKILHYSYRTVWQTYKKFTDYAIREAKQKIKRREKTSLKKIFLYPPHMFWARYVKDKGYKDGVFRIPLDLGFAYMEFLTYFLMLFL